MYLAEIHGKLTERDESKEDILLSNVFSFFKYTDRQIFLKRFISEVGISVTDVEANEAEFFFWPTFPDKTEPDLVIVIGAYYLLIEAKYKSGFGEETHTQRHQLDREIDGGALEAKSLGKIFKIVAVTADPAHPAIIGGISSHHFPDLIWLNWQKITLLIEKILSEKPSIPKVTRLFAEDLHKLLIRKKLRNYEGVSAFTREEMIMSIPDMIFFQSATARYRGAFIGFIPAIKDLEANPVIRGDIFFQQQKPLFSRDGFPELQITLNDSPIFFKRRTA